MRRATIERNTQETRITATVDLDGSGTYQVSTGIGFLDHRSEEHTSETPVTNAHIVCRLLLEKKTRYITRLKNILLDKCRRQYAILTDTQANHRLTGTILKRKQH